MSIGGYILLGLGALVVLWLLFRLGRTPPADDWSRKGDAPIAGLGAWGLGSRDNPNEPGGDLGGGGDGGGGGA